MSTKNAKRISIKWDVPHSNDSIPSLHPNVGYGVSVSKRDVNSNTYEEDSNQITTNYSDSFVSESYSDTFIKSTSSFTGVNQTSTQIDTVYSLLQSADIPEAAHLVTAETEGLETVLVVDYDDTFTDESSITVRKIERDRTLDIVSEVLPNNSYSDTFEISIQGESASLLSEHKSNEKELRCTKLFLDDETLSDHSYIAPDFDGQCLTDEEEEEGVVSSLRDEYSLTFEPIEPSSFGSVDVEKAKLEAEQVNIGELAKKEFIKQMMKNLKARPFQKDTQLETVPVSRSQDDEDDYLRYYCRKKLKLLKRKKQERRDDTVDKKAAATSKSAPENLSNYSVPKSILERAKLTNIMSAMKRAAQEEVHEPSKCEQCRELKSVLDFEDAQRQFVSAHAKRLKNKTMDAKIEEHLLKMNSLTLIAELARDLPKASEKPEKILDRLFEPLLGKNVMR